LYFFYLQEYVTHVDPSSQLGLTSDSVEGYRIGDIQRLSQPGGAHVPAPELLPCGYLVGDSNTINIRLRGKKPTALLSHGKLQLQGSERRIVGRGVGRNDQRSCTVSV